MESTGRYNISPSYERFISLVIRDSSTGPGSRGIWKGQSTRNPTTTWCFASVPPTGRLPRRWEVRRPCHHGVVLPPKSCASDGSSPLKLLLNYHVYPFLLLLVVSCTIFLVISAKNPLPALFLDGLPIFLIHDSLVKSTVFDDGSSIFHSNVNYCKIARFFLADLPMFIAEIIWKIPMTFMLFCHFGLSPHDIPRSSPAFPSHWIGGKFSGNSYIFNGKIDGFR